MEALAQLWLQPSYIPNSWLSIANEDLSFTFKKGFGKELVDKKPCSGRQHIGIWRDKDADGEVINLESSPSIF